MRKMISGVAAVLVLFALAACTLTQKKIAYQTLYGLEVSTTATYNGFLTEVVKGKAPTNDVPKISAAYNKFQVGIDNAAKLVQYDWTNLAPSSVIGLANDVLNGILEAKGTK